MGKRQLTAVDGSNHSNQQGVQERRPREEAPEGAAAAEAELELQ